MDGRQRLIASGALGLSALAWAVLYLHPHRGGFPAALLLWNVMLVAMMLPPVLPWLIALPRRHAMPFAGGYFAVWIGYCVVAAALQVRLGSALAAPAPAGAALLVAAGAFQFTPLKERCLRYCRTPVGSLLGQWRPGRGWPVRMGLTYGAHCLGCCWALMALCLAMGVMNLWWMAALTLVMSVEKLAPGGERWARVAGALLLVVGAGSLLVA